MAKPPLKQITRRHLTDRLSVEFQEGPQGVPALVRNGLAIIARKDAYGEAYSITHVATGRTIETSEYDLGLNQAWRVLLALLPLTDWTVSTWQGLAAASGLEFNELARRVREVSQQAAEIPPRPTPKTVTREDFPDDVSIRLRTGRTRSVWGRIHEELAVTRDPDRDGFTIIHVESGFSVYGGFRTLSKAWRGLLAIKPLIDGTLKNKVELKRAASCDLVPGALGRLVHDTMKRV